MESAQYFVYILANRTGNALYVGVTNNLKRRVYEHKNGIISGFTKRYNISKLIYFEIFDDPENAIRREKQLKGGSRQKKIDLINQTNRDWIDLYNKI